MDADQRDVLEQELVGGHLLDAARREAYDEDAPVPGGALGGEVHEADGVVDDVDAAALGRQGLDLLRPRLVVVGDYVVGAEALRDL